MMQYPHHVLSAIFVPHLRMRVCSLTKLFTFMEGMKGEWMEYFVVGGTTERVADAIIIMKKIERK